MGSGDLENEANFFWALIAKKIATIQTLEILSGAELIAQETNRFFQSVDRELFHMFEPSVRYMKDTTKTYKDTVDLAQASKLEDILMLVHSTLQARAEAQKFSELSRANSMNYSFK